MSGGSVPLPRHHRTSYGQFLTVFTTAGFILVVLAARTNLITYDSPHFGDEFDHIKYIYMAQHNPFDFHIATFCWRVLGPLLAKFMPFGLQNNFFLISFVSIWASAVLVYYLSRALHFAHAYAFFGVLLFLSIGAETKLLLSNFWYSDPLGLFFTTLATYLVVTKRALLFALVLALGVAAREFVLIAASLQYSLNARRLVDARSAIKTVLLALPALMVMFGIRVLIPAKNDDPRYLAKLTYQLKIVQNGSSSIDSPQHLVRVFGHNITHLKTVAGNVETVALGMTVLVVALAVLGAVRRPDLLLRFSPLFLGAFLELFFYPPTRYIVAMGPLLVVLALFGVEEVIERVRVPVVVLYGLPIVLIVLNLQSRSRYTSKTPLQILVILTYAALVAGYALITGRRNVPEALPR